MGTDQGPFATPEFGGAAEASGGVDINALGFREKLVELSPSFFKHRLLFSLCPPFFL
jgi:hypothetical protein